jgi:two-component system, LuxR family, response regulator FixJ
MAARALIHVIDDDLAMRDSLAFLLEANGYDVETHESALTFLDQGVKADIECVVSDIRMPGMNGVDLVRQLKAVGIACPVVLMTGHGDVNLAVEAMKAGALDFIEKPFPDDVLLTAIGSALNARARDVPKEALRREAQSRLAGLTPRDRDVLAGLIAGKTNKVIGQDLGISPRTVEVYRANLMVKTGAQSVAELVRIALSAGF